MTPSRRCDTGAVCARATDDITKRVTAIQGGTHAAESATEIAANITSVSAGASSTSEAAGEASRTTQTVVTVVGDLKTTVDTG